MKHPSMQYLLDRFDIALEGGQIVGQNVLMDVQGGQSKGDVGLKLGRKAFLGDVIAALHKQVVEGVQIGLR